MIGQNDHKILYQNSVLDVEFMKYLDVTKELFTKKSYFVEVFHFKITCLNRIIY